MSVLIKRLFRKEPVISTVVTAGTVNIFLGMLEGQAMLAFLGVLVVSGTIVLRGWQKYRRPVDFPEQLPLRYLPDQTARPAVPMLGLSSRRELPPPQ
ncbi:MAG: hypothetical protein F6K42_33215 [Leptolyngbya sp. SIO1D8]|nr:hypothetical protein [Leptolyngbya sp. SIO1D8]